MQTITPAQARAIEVITKSLDSIAPGRGKDYMDVILGILNLEMPTQSERSHTIYTGIGNDTPVKSLEEPEKYPMEDAVSEEYPVEYPMKTLLRNQDIKDYETI